MSKNTKPDNLEREIAALPDALKAAHVPDESKTVILARYVHGVTESSWNEAAREYQLSKWHARETDEQSKELGDGPDELPISPFRDVAGALTKNMFDKQLRREVLRLNRNGGSLTLISLAIADRKRLNTALGEATVERLENLLGSTILKRLEDCDSLGFLRKRQYICSLPGLGQLAARNFAEKIKNDFEDAARPFFPTGGISAGHGANCAIGIVNVPQGESGTVPDLLKRAKTALELALNKDKTLIYQEGAFSPLENPTLVQSSEKRFLFFGGDTE